MSEFWQRILHRQEQLLPKPVNDLYLLAVNGYQDAQVRLVSNIQQFVNANRKIVEDLYKARERIKLTKHNLAMAVVTPPERSRIHPFILAAGDEGIVAMVPSLSCTEAAINALRGRLQQAGSYGIFVSSPDPILHRRGKVSRVILEFAENHTEASGRLNYAGGDISSEDYVMGDFYGIIRPVSDASDHVIIPVASYPSQPDRRRS